MGRKFKYDILTLIEVVECQACIWDNANEQYKNKIARKKAWRDVCKILEPDFENYEIKNQEELLTIVMNKWTHIRDSFMRSMKTKSGQGAKRKYIYAEAMQFLLKNMMPDETESSIPSTRDENSDFDEPRASSSSHTDIPKRNKRAKLNTVHQEILNAIRSRSPRREALQPIDEDYAFILSLLPTLKKISEDDKLDFRIEVMQLLNRYSKRNQRRFNIVASAQESTY